MIFGATTSDMVDGDLGGLEHLKKGITMENIAEKLKILEDLSASSQRRGMNMKRAVIDMLTDADKFGRFAPESSGDYEGSSIRLSFLGCPEIQ